MVSAGYENWCPTAMCIIPGFADVQLELIYKIKSQGVNLAKTFENLIQSDNRFIIPAKRHLGMVVFALRGGNELTELLLKRLNSTGRLHAVPAMLKEQYVIRFTITSPQTTEDDVVRDSTIIKHLASRVLNEQGMI